MASSGTAFLAAYLPWRRLAHRERVALVERTSAMRDPKLQHAIDFLRRGLVIEEKLADESDAKASALPPPDGGPAARAGEIARDLAIATALAAHVAYLRAAAPDHAALREQAAKCAQSVREGVANVTKTLAAMGSPLLADHATSLSKYAGVVRDLEPTNADGYRELNEFLQFMNGFFQEAARKLDVPAPAQPTSAPSEQENALWAEILKRPWDYKVRLKWSNFADKRRDPRAKLVLIQVAPIDGTDDYQVASDLIRSHPEWSAPLAELGARDIKFVDGFPGDITVDASTFLARGAEMVATAPIVRLRVRSAKGRVREIMESPLLATIAMLDLDDQGVTDDDLVALASSPHAANLQRLDLRYNPIYPRGIEALAASPHLKHLEMVNLDGNPDDPVDRLQYYDETNTERVPTEAGKALEAKCGPLRWLHPG